MSLSEEMLAREDASLSVNVLSIAQTLATLKSVAGQSLPTRRFLLGLIWNGLLSLRIKGRSTVIYQAPRILLRIGRMRNLTSLTEDMNIRLQPMNSTLGMNLGLRLRRAQF